MKKLDQLRQQCLTLMVKKNLLKKGSQAILAKKINRNKNSISMALTGYRCGPGTEQILIELKTYLLNAQGRGADVNLPQG